MKTLKKFEKTIDERIAELCDRIKQRSAAHEAVDFSEYVRWWLADVYSHIAYGEPLGCVARGHDVNGLIDAIQSAYSMVGTVAVLPWLFIPLIKNALLKKLVVPYLKASKGIKKLTDNYENMMVKRSTEPHLKFRPCLFDSLLIPNPSRESLSPSEIAAEHILFTSAALDGLAAFISPFIDHVTQNPSIYRTLMAEITDFERRGALSGPVVSHAETTALPYFMACISECLRFESPAQTILPRYVSAGGLVYDGEVIPAGTEMAASPYIIHRSRAVFGEDADTFRPERWLEDQERSARMERYGMWWGYGTRQCTGKYLAQMQMQKLCLEILRRFEVKAKDPERRFVHKRWAVGMFWEQEMMFRSREMGKY